MPKGQKYTPKNVGMGASRTPKEVMGSQGKPATIKPDHFMNRPTNNTTFEQGTMPRHGKKSMKKKM